MKLLIEGTADVSYSGVLMFEQIITKTTRNAAGGFFLAGLFTLNCSILDIHQVNKEATLSDSAEKVTVVDRTELAEDMRYAGELAVAGMVEIGAGLGLVRAGQRLELSLHHQRLNREADAARAELAQEASRRSALTAPL